MIVALSVYSGDAAAAQRLLDWIAELGGVNGHSLVLATTPQVNAEPLLESARKAWGSVEQFLVNAQVDTIGWPIGPNRSFHAVCNHLQRRGQPFFFLESDCTPVVANWLDQLEREYHANAKPFMGLVHSMVNPHTGQVMPDTLHMNGAGIYPPNVDQHLPTLAFLTTALANEPFDVALRWEVLYRVAPTGGFVLDENKNRVSACHATDKICFCWRTKNYRVENDDLVYDVEGPRAHTAKLDFWKHVLHHGCKDGSLIDVLRQRLNPKPKLVTKIVEPEPMVHQSWRHGQSNPQPAPIPTVIPPATITALSDDRSAPRQIAKRRGGARKGAGRKPKNVQSEPVSV